MPVHGSIQYVDKIVVRGGITGNGIFMDDGTSVVDKDGNVDADITAADLTTTGDTTLGDTSADAVTINGTTTANAPITVGVNDTGYDVKYFGATSGSYCLWDESANELVLNASTLQLGGKVKFALNGGAASASGLLMGVGTSANPATTAVAGSIFSEFRTQSTATSGDSRSLYLRHDINGAGGGGEALRAFAKVTAAATTARGAHISIDLDAAGTVSGFGAGVDAQVLFGDTAYTNTVTALNAELYSAGSSTSIAADSASFLRCVLGGDSTGAADIEDNCNLIQILGGSIAGSNLVQAETDETKFSHKIRINAYGTTLYLMATAT